VESEVKACTPVGCSARYQCPGPCVGRLNLVLGNSLGR
jgi:hypothetical protein